MTREEYEKRVKDLPRVFLDKYICVCTDVHVYAVKDLVKTAGCWGVTSPSTEPGGERYTVEVDAGLLAPDANSAHLMEVLLHELMHVVEGIFGLNMREAQVRILALGLKDLLYPMAFIPVDDLQRWRALAQSVLEQSESPRPEGDTRTQNREPSPG